MNRYEFDDNEEAEGDEDVSNEDGGEVNAYDYEAQRWVSGSEAAELLDRQARETAEVIAENPGFLAFIGVKMVDADNG